MQLFLSWLAVGFALLQLSEASMNESGGNITEWNTGNSTALTNSTSEDDFHQESSGEIETEDHQFHQGKSVAESPTENPKGHDAEDLQILQSAEDHVELVTHKPTVLLMRDDGDIDETTLSIMGVVTNNDTTVSSVSHTQRNTTQDYIAIGFYSLLRDRVLATGLIAGLISIALVAIFSLAVLALCQNYRKQHYGEWMVNGSHNYNHEIDPQFFENGGFMYDNCPISGVVERRLVLSVGDHPIEKPTAGGYDNPALELDGEAHGKQLGRWFVPLRTLELMEKIKTDTDTFEMTEKTTDVILED